MRGDSSQANTGIASGRLECRLAHVTVWRPPASPTQEGHIYWQWQPDSLGLWLVAQRTLPTSLMLKLDKDLVA